MTDIQRRFDEIVDKFRENNLKLTPQRLAIIRILAASEGHPGVETIYGRIRKRFPTMSLATVYRNVMLIKEMGQVLELGFADGGNRYDGSRPYPHPHIVCVRCKKIIDPNLESLQDMTAEVKSETGFEILTHRLDFFGICPECNV